MVTDAVAQAGARVFVVSPATKTARFFFKYFGVFRGGFAMLFSVFFGEFVWDVLLQVLVF